MPSFCKLPRSSLPPPGTGAATPTVMNEDIPELAVPDRPWVGAGALDGRAFTIHGIYLDSGARLTDELPFRDGTFQSEATTLCPDAPHTVVWYGAVVGDEITVDVTWTTRRGYWTNQIAIEASGAIVLRIVLLVVVLGLVFTPRNLRNDRARGVTRAYAPSPPH